MLLLLGRPGGRRAASRARCCGGDGRFAALVFALHRRRRGAATRYRWAPGDPTARAGSPVDDFRGVSCPTKPLRSRLVLVAEHGSGCRFFFVCVRCDVGRRDPCRVCRAQQKTDLNSRGVTNPKAKHSASVGIVPATQQQTSRLGFVATDRAVVQRHRAESVVDATAASVAVFADRAVVQCQGGGWASLWLSKVGDAAA
jgi:hypothetical protein